MQKRDLSTKLLPNQSTHIRIPSFIWSSLRQPPDRKEATLPCWQFKVLRRGDVCTLLFRRLLFPQDGKRRSKRMWLKWLARQMSQPPRECCLQMTIRALKSSAIRGKCLKTWHLFRNSRVLLLRQISECATFWTEDVSDSQRWPKSKIGKSRKLATEGCTHLDRLLTGVTAMIGSGPQITQEARKEGWVP